MLQSRNVYNVYTILSINYSFFCSVMFIYPMRYIWRRQLPREYHCNYKILQLYTRYHKIYYIILSHFWFVSSSKKTSGKPRHPWPLSGNLPSIDARVAALQAILSGCFTHGEPGGNWGVPGTVEPARHQALVEPARQGDDGAISALAGSMQEQQIALEVAGRCSRIGINIWY